jgi:TRAP-type C4-dicarboxylate transport system permease small subunit
MSTFVAGLERILCGLDRVVRVVVVTALLSMTAVLFLNSIGRSVLNISFVGGPALGRLLVIWLTFLGAYLAVRSGAHITVDIVQRLLPARWLRRLDIVVGVTGAATCGYVASLGAAFTWTRLAVGQIDPMLEISSAWFYLPVPLGSGLMVLAFVQSALQAAFSVPPDADTTQPAGLADIRTGH